MAESLDVRIILSSGSFVEITLPEGAGLQGFVSSIRSLGFLCTDTIYVPAEEIASIFVISAITIRNAPVETPAKKDLN